jgi:EAL domain-containing protein (putative c-di-GMP-specific phosphodiesterase class I)
LLPPDQFIGLAEQTGLIARLTNWVLGAALRQARTWHDAGLDIQVAVNLSMRDVRDPALAETLAMRLAHAGVPARLLQIELTESTLMADVERAIEILSRVRALGVQIAIDDFGTGYSSLALLKRLPVDALKIDRSFMRDVATDESDLAIVRATVNMAQSLGLQVVAEGVEDEAALDVLVQLGCDQAQGYYFSRPKPAAELVFLADELQRAA